MSTPDPAGTRSPAPPRRLADLVTTHWQLTIILAAFGLSAGVVPTLAPVALLDDWIYTRAAEVLLERGELVVPDVAAATTVFEAMWGALFGAIFGMTPGVTRLSTVVLVGASAVPFYGLCLGLGVARRWAALGTAIYLFNPVTYSLTFSFMTDAHLMALSVGALFAYVRGLRTDRAAWVVGGSILAALAFLARPQGLVIPGAVALWLVATRRLRVDLPSVRLAAQVLAAPAAATLAYLVWTAAVGAPAAQDAFSDAMRAAGVGDTMRLADEILYSSLMYLGLLALPITVATVTTMRPPLRLPRWGWVVVGCWVLFLTRGLLRTADADRWMPYSGGWFNNTGLGSLHDAVLGGRPPLAGSWAFIVLTGICFASSALLAVIIVRQPPRWPEWPLLAGMVAVIMIAGILPPSFFFGTMIDRYFLAVLPFALVFLLSRISTPRVHLGWLVVAGFAIVSIAGTRDALVMQRRIWSLAESATSAGVPLDRLDGGASWDGWRLWGDEKESPGHWLATGATPPQEGTWWVRLFAPAIDPEYIVATQAQPGYQTVEDVEYSSWLHRRPTHLLLQRRVAEGADS